MYPINTIFKVVELTKFKIKGVNDKGEKVILAKTKVPKYTEVGDIIRHCEHGHYDVINEKGELVYRSKKTIDKKDYGHRTALYYNRELDAFLQNDGIISLEILKAFKDAYRDGGATPTQWLQKKLGIIKKQLVLGNSYSIEKNPKRNLIKNLADFKKWIAEEFPDLA